MKFLKSFAAAAVSVCILTVSCCHVCAASGFTVKKAQLLNYSGGKTTVSIPDKVKTIGKKAFAGNKKIKKVVMASGVQKIQASAFKGCTQLKKVEIPKSVRYIANNAFSKCRNVTIITQKGAYALKFAKKNKIPWKIKNTNKDDTSKDAQASPVHKITSMECYLYTAGTSPCNAEKKTVTDISVLDKIYESLLLFDSGTEAKSEDMVSGGKRLRVVVHFSDHESREIECSPGVYSENGTAHKIAQGVSIINFWNSIEAAITGL